MAPESTMAAKLTAEFLGTFLLVFTVGCNVLSSNPVWGGVSIASVLMVAIYALGKISGGQFNPAVTLSILLCGHPDTTSMDGKTAAMYMGAQLAGGFTASLGYSFLFWSSFGIGPAAGFSFAEVGFAEMLYTFMLCFVVLNVAVARENCDNQFYGLAIAWVIVAGAYGAGAISGGCFNPAVSLAIDVTAPKASLFWGLLYVCCEFLGAALAAGAFWLVRPRDYGREKSVVTEALSEFLGTFFLVLTVGLNVMAKSRSGVFSIAASLMSMIYALGDVSGAHFNPAVTLAIFLSGRCKSDLTPAKAGIFVGSQLAGAVVAGVTYCIIHGGDSFPLGPAKGWGMHNVDVVEAIFTFLLCYVVLCVAVSGTTKASTMFGLAIGACVVGGGKAIGDISGGSLNPAVSFGITVADLPSGGPVLPLLSYVAAECIGAGMAAAVFQVTHAVDKVEVEKDIGA